MKHLVTTCLTNVPLCTFLLFFCDATATDNPAYPVGAYAESKTLAESAAWEFWRSLPEGDRFELATVNPTFVQGPMLTAQAGSSADIPRQMLLGLMPTLVDTDLFLCHIYDVAKVHLLAMTTPEAAGHRFIVHSGTCDMKHYAETLSKEFAPLGYTKVPSMVAPRPLLWLLKFFDAQVAEIYSSVGKRVFIQPRDVKAVLGYDVVAEIDCKYIPAAVHMYTIPLYSI
jgi:dihydroflavonol-4-reductase